MGTAFCQNRGDAEPHRHGQSLPCSSDQEHCGGRVHWAAWAPRWWPGTWLSGFRTAAAPALRLGLSGDASTCRWDLPHRGHGPDRSAPRERAAGDAGTCRLHRSERHRPATGRRAHHRPDAVRGAGHDRVDGNLLLRGFEMILLFANPFWNHAIAAAGKWAVLIDWFTVGAPGSEFPDSRVAAEALPVSTCARGHRPT